QQIHVQIAVASNPPRGVRPSAHGSAASSDAPALAEPSQCLLHVLPDPTGELEIFAAPFGKLGGPIAPARRQDLDGRAQYIGLYADVMMPASLDWGRSRA